MTARTERFEAVVVGGGQAGLAVGYHLIRHGVDFAILSDEPRVGEGWRRRWDSLRLFTPARHSGLPGMPFPAPPRHLADKDEVANYLEAYAERFDLPVRLNARVGALAHDGARYRLGVSGSDVAIEADNVVVATGAFQRPRIPAVSEQVCADIVQLHSSEYRNPFVLPAGPVLVVGAGNSGAQIALELSRERKVWLAGRETGHLPRRVLARDIFDWAWPLMSWATTDSAVGRRMREKTRGRGDALIGIPERDIKAAGIIRVGRLRHVRGGHPICGDTVLRPAVIVWCTGFAPDFGWIDLAAFDADGYPRHRRGELADFPGLFFVGLRFQHRMTSSLLGGVGSDAAWVAARVAARCEAVLDE